MSRKIVVVGGVAGGASVAARLRRLSEEDEIIMVERGEYISFANCGLPYYIGGVITERQKLLVQTVERMSKRFNLDIRVLSEVVQINKEEKTITIKNVTTNETYNEKYDVLILSPGAKPIVPSIPGLKKRRHCLRYEMYRIQIVLKHTLMSRNHVMRRLLVADLLVWRWLKIKRTWIDVTLVEMANQVMPPIDYEMAAYVHEHLQNTMLSSFLKMV